MGCVVVLEVTLNERENTWHPHLNVSSSPPAAQLDEIDIQHEGIEAEAVDYDNAHETDTDELLTPAARATMNIESDNENDGDPLQTPRQPGQRVKTDARDSLDLAEYSRAGALTPVWIPDPSLSGILCARHSMTIRSMYAKQDEVE